MEDLRIIKTKEAIRQAFESLISERGYSHVNVSQIAERARINRNTFYLHYDCKEDLVRDIARELLAAQDSSLKISDFVNARNNKRKLYEQFLKFLEVINKDIEIYRIMLTDPNLAGYLSNTITTVKNATSKILRNNKKIDIGIEYMTSGILGIIKKWVVYDIGTIEENAKVLTEMTISSFRRLTLGIV